MQKATGSFEFLPLVFATNLCLYCLVYNTKQRFLSWFFFMSKYARCGSNVLLLATMLYLVQRSSIAEKAAFTLNSSLTQITKN